MLGLSLTPDIEWFPDVSPMQAQQMIDERNWAILEKGNELYGQPRYALIETKKYGQVVAYIESACGSGRVSNPPDENDFSIPIQIIYKIVAKIQ